MSPLPFNEAVDCLSDFLVAMRLQPTHQLITALLVALGRATGLFVFRLVLIFRLTRSFLDTLDFTILLRWL